VIKRKTKEQFKNEFIKNARIKYGDQYTFDKVNYINSRTPVIITCKDHGDFKRKPSLFLNGRTCSKCNADNTLNGTDKESRVRSYINKGKNKYEDQYDYSKIEEDFIDRNSEVKIICKDHGEFTVKMLYHLSNEGTSGCKDCGHWDLSAKINSRYTEERFSNEIKEMGLYDVVLSSFTGLKSTCKLLCPIHGEFERIARTMLQGGKCPDCDKEAKRKRMSRTKEQFIVESKGLYDDLFSYDKLEYKNDKTEVELYCNKHSKYFFVTPHFHLNEYSYSGCRECDSELSKEK